MNRVNGQVRKRQKRISNVTRDGEEHSMIWEMFIAVTMESAIFMGKNFRQISHLNKCSTYLRNWCLNKMRSQDWRQLVGINHSWKYLSLIGDERIINLQRTKVCVFLDSVLCLGKILRTLEPIDALEQRLGRIKSSQSYRDLDRIRMLGKCSTRIFVCKKIWKRTMVIHWSWF